MYATWDQPDSLGAAKKSHLDFCSFFWKITGFFQLETRHEWFPTSEITFKRATAARIVWATFSLIKHLCKNLISILRPLQFPRTYATQIKAPLVSRNKSTQIKLHSNLQETVSCRQQGLYSFASMTATPVNLR